MEIQEPTLYSFYFNRILGLAPFLIRRNNKSRIDEIRLALWISIYSMGLLIVSGKIRCFQKKKNRKKIEKKYQNLLIYHEIVYLTVRFIFIDADSKTPIR